MLKGGEMDFLSFILFFVRVPALIYMHIIWHAPQNNSHNASVRFTFFDAARTEDCDKVATEKTSSENPTPGAGVFWEHKSQKGRILDSTAFELERRAALSKWNLDWNPAPVCGRPWMI